MKPILFIYIGVQAINALFSGFLWFYNKTQKSYRYLTLLWIGNLLNFGSQFYFNNNEYMTAMTLGFYFICSFSLVKLYETSLERYKIPYTKFIILFVTGLILCSVFTLFGLNFTLISLPIAISVTAPTLYLSIIKILPRWKKSDYFEKCFAILILLNSIHFLDYPFLRKDPNFAPIGFAIAFVFMFSFTVFLPVFTSKYLERKNLDELEEMVMSRTSELNKTKEEKAQLVNILCHDLSSPLLILRVHLSNIKEIIDKSTGTEQSLKRCEFAIDKIISMLEQVKNMAAIEEGKQNIDMEPIKPAQIVKTCKDMFSEQMEKKSITFEITNHIKENSSFIANEIILSHNIISNFLSNSIKFTPKNGLIKIDFFETIDQCNIKITDSGLGMHKDEIAKVFKSSKLSEKGTDGEKGTGLGLSVALFYIDKLQAQLNIDSRPEDLFPNNSGTEINISFKKILLLNKEIA
ncbi:MAG: sensor histidine kinase [Bacteriovoracaceae bacterium]|jgi:signal transduction histidine kinase|nr:sensor histidine kinase [Bacteriovoracaceae bacterium]